MDVNHNEKVENEISKSLNEKNEEKDEKVDGLFDEMPKEREDMEVTKKEENEQSFTDISKNDKIVEDNKVLEETNKEIEVNVSENAKKEKNKFSFVRLIILAIVLLIIGLLVFRRLTMKKVVAMQELPVVDVINVGKGNIYNSVAVSGKIMPQDTYKVLTKTGGEITKIYVKNGDYVKYGDPICEIDNKKKIDSAFISYDTSKKQYERMKVLYDRGDISKQSFEQVKAQYEANKLAYDTQVEFATPTATGTGYVDNTNMFLGENKGSDEICCYITSDKGKEIQFSVTERAIKGINIGDNVVVEKAGKNYDAVIYDKSTLINDKTGLFDIKASFKESNDLSQGVMAKVTAIYGESLETMILPRNVIYYENEKPLVYTVDVDGKIVSKFLTLGIETDDEVEVLDGIGERTKVISTWSSDLVDGTEIKVISTSIYEPIKKVGRKNELKVNEKTNVVVNEPILLEKSTKSEIKDDIKDKNNNTFKENKE